MNETKVSERLCPSGDLAVSCHFRRFDCFVRVVFVFYCILGDVMSTSRG